MKNKIEKNIPYRSQFLVDYQPNQTFYLSKEHREQLFKWGLQEDGKGATYQVREKLLKNLIIDLTWNSSRLEGNTYGLLETKKLVEVGKISTKRTALESQMIINHKEAIEYLGRVADDTHLTSLTVRSVHALLSENLLNNSANSGTLREVQVLISGSNYVPLDNYSKILEMFNLVIEKYNIINDPFEKSFFVFIHLSYLQAFIDVNKRTSRLISNISLIRSGLKPLSFVGVKEQEYIDALLSVYEKNDLNPAIQLYMTAYDQSCSNYSGKQLETGPNKTKLYHRTLIIELVRAVVIDLKSIDFVSEQLQMRNLNLELQQELYELINEELVHLHEGNIIRYKISVDEFNKWKNL